MRHWFVSLAAVATGTLFCRTVAGEVIPLRGLRAVTQPIVLTPEDSGKTFVGTEEATISGGVVIGPWRDCGNGVWEANAPKADGMPMFFDQLWTEGRRLSNARLPNEGYLMATKVHQEPVTNAAGAVAWWESATFTNAVVDALADLSAEELSYVRVGVIVKWSYAQRTPHAFDSKTRRLVTGPDGKWSAWKAWNDRVLFSFDNVRTAFDAPGEWFLDMQAGKVLYRPRKGEDPARMTFVAPRRGLSQVVVFKGDPKNGRFVENVTFRNVTFAHTDYLAAPGERGPRVINQHQAADSADGAVTMEGARNCVFENCRFVHTANYGLRMDDGCVSNRVVGCLFEDLGAGGIWMGERKPKSTGRRILLPTSPTATAFNLVSNCTIRAGGRYNPEGVGVMLAHCSDTRVVHNDIHDILYSGVNVGWTWGYGGSVAQRNEIGFNRIWDLGKGVMSDMGGVYTLGTSFGTRIHDNVIHDIRSHQYGGWGLYTDEGSEGIVLERNVCWNTTSGGFYQHFGTGNRVVNNIFAWNGATGGVHAGRDVVDGIPCSDDLVCNIVLVREGPLVGSGARNVGGTWANNLWWDVRGAESACLDGLTWKQWQASGKETGGRLADPGFVDAAACDFRLKEDSPAFALGFEPFDYSAAGRKDR